MIELTQIDIKSAETKIGLVAQILQQVKQSVKKCFEDAKSQIKSIVENETNDMPDVPS